MVVRFQMKDGAPKGDGAADLPTSKAGEAIGDSSVVMEKIPSNFPLGEG